MPELPEVETVCRGLALKLLGRRLVHVEQRRANLRFPFPADFASRLAGRRVEAIRRRAKYIVIDLDDGQILLVHLGMSGSMVVNEKRPALLDRHDHVVFDIDDGTCVRFNDARRFGMMDLVAAADFAGHKLIRGLGLEPLDPAFDGKALAAMLKGRKTAVKLAIMDQRLVVGVGNIYASEALHRAGISPKRQAGTVQGERAAKLAAAIKQVLKDAIKAGGSSLRDYVQANGELGYFQHRWKVYDREGEPCRICGGPIRRLTQGGRSTFYCPTDQR
ncbi:DNA-(apurinic or apyrimidinic site) lyase [Dongia mobilis]|uniref:Formamidopyrimidine-DNA glycosylase n=1 Tax=Dongia mobilis TaxID=578943 RepID=A0A4V3DF58_9PROT|nr:bifunctional DNA-formamidopyrimidine glycosylase/DNA-(apurinic or apyrimidinic site) lyase [Dongia mobilis]TDQ86375.1 DNA-(apurinic or apyrimidinic site) lyase [Dongia mobilis]